MAKNTFILLFIFIALMVSVKAQADETACDTDLTYEEAKAASDYKYVYEVNFDLLDGVTEDSDLFCWIGNIDLDVAIKNWEDSKAEHNFFTSIPKTCSIFAELDENLVTLNCIQDVTLEGDEKVVLHRTEILYTPL